MHGPQPQVSIVILAWNHIEYTRACLEALRAHTPLDGVEVIVVDNGSTDGTGAWLATLGNPVRALTLPENLGFARGANYGARAARGRYLVFLNNDTVPQPGWLGALLDVLEADRAVGVVGAKLLFPGTLQVQHAGVVFGAPRVPYHIYEGWNADHPAVNRVRDFQAVTAACFVLRREDFWRLGGFDEGYQMGLEDIDLCLRLGELGLRAVYTPHSVLYHHAQASIRDDTLYSEKMKGNTRRFQERWGARVRFDALEHYAADGLATRPSPGGTLQFVAQPGRAFTTVVMPVRDARSSLTACLKTLFNFWNSGEVFDLVLIDRGSTDGSREYLEQVAARLPGTTVLGAPAGSFAAAANLGLRAAVGRYVVLLAPDTRLTQGWLGRLRAHLAPGVGAVGPLSNVGPDAQHVGRYLAGWQGQPDDAVVAAVRSVPPVSLDAAVLDRACVVMPRAVLDRVGLFDERCADHEVELEYFLRLRSAGYRICVASDVYVPRAVGLPGSLALQPAR